MRSMINRRRWHGDYVGWRTSTPLPITSDHYNTTATPSEKNKLPRIRIVSQLGHISKWMLKVEVNGEYKIEISTFFRLGSPHKKLAHWLPGRCLGTYKHPSSPYLVKYLPLCSSIISIPRWCTIISWACIPYPSAYFILLMLIMTTLSKVC